MACLLAQVAFKDFLSITVGCDVAVFGTQITVEFVRPLWTSVFLGMIHFTAPTLLSWCWWVGSSHLASHVS